MAASYTLDVNGKIKFIHAVNFNKFDKWAVTFYPDNESLEKIRDLQAKGLKNVMKKDDDGYFIQFSREPTKLIRGKVVAFAAPKVVDVEGKPFDGMRVGWGSDATIRLEVYQHGTPNGGKSYAARWDSLKVINLVPFEMDKSDWSEEDKDNIKSLTKVPEPSLTVMWDQ